MDALSLEVHKHDVPCVGVMYFADFWRVRCCECFLWLIDTYHAYNRDCVETARFTEEPGVCRSCGKVVHPPKP